MESRWRVRARVFGRHPLQPIWEAESEEMTVSHQYEMNSDELLRDVGLDEMCHYAEFHPFSLDVAPSHEQIVAPLFVHYTSLDGSFAAHLPSSYIYGSARAYKLGRSGAKYQQFPCIEVQQPFRTQILTVNPNLRKVRYSVYLVGENGKKVEDGPITIPPKAISKWESDGKGVQALGKSAGVIISSDVRVSSFVGTLHTGVGRLVGMDHTHPFFPA